MRWFIGAPLPDRTNNTVVIDAMVKNLKEQLLFAMQDLNMSRVRAIEHVKAHTVSGPKVWEKALKELDNEEI